MDTRSEFGIVICSYDADNHTFRDAAGNAQAGSLELCLEDLLAADARDRLTADALNQRVVLDFRHLATLLDEAEGMPVVQGSRNGKKRKRILTVAEKEKRQRLEEWELHCMVTRKSARRPRQD